MSEQIMSGTVTTLPRKASRWILIAAPMLALFGAVAAPAQAGDYYGGYRYEDSPRYGYGYGYGYHPRCTSWRCGSGARRSGVVLERRYRYVERDYYERRTTAPVHHYHHYGWNAPRSYYPGYRTGEAAFPWGYGGVRQHPYGWYRRRPYDGYGSSAYDDVERPPAPVGDDGGYYGEE
jgi:hypothetical protein